MSIHACLYSIHTCCVLYVSYYLYDKVADYSAVVRVHAWAECVEYSGHAHLHSRLTLICVPDRIEVGYV